MSEIYVKLSELSRPGTPVNDSDVVFISQLNDTENVSTAMPISDLRDLLNFETAYDTTTIGLSKTKANQIFYVYADSQKLSVNPYYNRNGVAEAVTDSSGNKLQYATLLFMQKWFTYYGYSLIKEVPSFAALRTLPVLVEGQKVKLRGYYENTDVGGGEFVGHIGTATDDGGVVAAGSGFYWERVDKSPLYLTFFGANGTVAADDDAKNKAIAYCSVKNVDLYIPNGKWFFSTPINWNPKRYSIIGDGSALVDFSNLPSGSYGVTIATETESAGNMWVSATHELTSIQFLGSAGRHFFKNDQVNGSSAPQVNVRNLLINNFDDNVLFGNNQWCVCFSRCHFRGNSAGNTRFIVVNKTYNACENMRFDGCTFNGSNAALAIAHIAGTCEFTFDGCSFDYCHGVLTATNPGSRGLWRFSNCHFEDDGSVQEFNLNTAAAPFYVDLIDCDWAFITKDTTSGNNVIPATLGTFTSTSAASAVRVMGNLFPIYDTTVARNATQLFTIPTGSAVAFINLGGNIIEQATNQYFNVLSAAQNKFLDITSDNLTSALLVTNGAGSKTYDITDTPTTYLKQGTWVFTGVISASMMMQLNSEKRVNVSGNFKRSNSVYYFDVRFFDSSLTQISRVVLGIPGTVGSWARFGQSIVPPKGACYVRMGWSYSTAPSATDTIKVNDIILEQ